MKTTDPFAPPTPQSIAGYVKKNAPKVRQMQNMMMGDHGGIASVRTAEYQGHHIVVKTSYAVTVDGKPLMGHFGVSNSGQVHYHGIPNMTFDSAIDLVKKVIDVFPGDFARPATTGSGAMHGMSGGMSKSKRASNRARRKKGSSHK